MRLHSLTLQGYKSFAAKTEFLFPTGITAIVGPNGSGKSNIADAIRWVLGEQSMRTLRGKSTADMIFAGGRRRAPAGMAEVSLTFDNSDGWLPVEFSEVTLTRRAYRSGENEYLINGARVRLRDVSELLAESGLTQSSHIVIGQGMVDAALSLRPQERRTLFEDAAGISVYRAQRAEAVGRLDETQHNLERVYDIVGEIKPRLERLAREAERVEEHRRMEAHLERLQSTWYGYHWGRLQTALDHALRVAAALETRQGEQQAEITRLEEQLAALRRRESELRDQLRDWLRESADLHEQANELQREMAVAEERARLLRRQREELTAEIGPLTEQQAAQAERATQAQAALADLERESSERRETLARLERDWEAVKRRAAEAAKRRTAAEQELRAQRAQVERLNRALAEARAEAIRRAQAQAVAEERARQAQARLAEVLAELEPLLAQREAQAGRVTEARALLEQLQRDLAERKRQTAELEREWAAFKRQADPREIPDLGGKAELERELRERRDRRKELESRLAESRAEAARLGGELDALNRLSPAGAAANQGALALLDARLPGVLGPLAALIRVESAWETAIEQALGDDLQAIVVERAALVDEVRRVLEQAGGRVTLLPLDGLRPPPPLPAGALRAADVIACDAHIRPAVEAVAGAVALCADGEAARALFPALPPGGRCLTAAGDVLRAEGALALGQMQVRGKRPAGILATERARRELPAQVETARARCREIEAQQRQESERIAALEARLRELERQAAAAREEAAQARRERIAQSQTAVAVAEESLRNQQAALRREEAMLERLESQIASLRRQAAELERAAAGAAAGPPTHAGARTTDITRIEEQQQAALEEVAACETRLQEVSREAAAAAEEAARVERETIGPARTALAVAEESLRSRRAAVERETALAERLRAQATARRQRADELEAEQDALAARLEEQREEAARLEAQLEESRARIQPAEAQLARLRAEQAALEEQERNLRARLRDTETQHGRAQMEVSRRRDELKLLARRIEEDLGLVELEIAESVTAQTPLPLHPMVSPLPIVEELPDGLEEEIQRLKAHLRRMGAVNPNAPADYAEVQERYRFLTEQAADLEAASSKLRQVVEELDRVMTEAFQKTFDAAAARFSELFTLLFNGGGAHLELVEPENGEGKTILNSGVEIVARPPGKRAQRLALLSGGERSLTAVALLFAILQVSPTPFCVLDEVDAMLDEANVGRFRALLEELSRQTQFIIITHNRHTTETAQTIYGVSMGAEAVSQVVSLKFEEAAGDAPGGAAARGARLAGEHDRPPLS